jgi:hypothetical protein
MLSRRKLFGFLAAAPVAAVASAKALAKEPSLVSVKIQHPAFGTTTLQVEHLSALDANLGTVTTSQFRISGDRFIIND